MVSKYLKHVKNLHLPYMGIQFVEQKVIDIISQEDENSGVAVMR